MEEFEGLFQWFGRNKAELLPPAVVPAGVVAYLSSFAARDVSGESQIPESLSRLRLMGVAAVFISDLFMTPAQLTQARVLVIENLCCLSRSFQDAVVAWAVGGGTVIIDHHSGTMDEIGRSRDANSTLLQQLASAPHLIVGSILDSPTAVRAVAPFSWLATAQGWEVVPYKQPQAARCGRVVIHFSNMTAGANSSADDSLRLRLPTTDSKCVVTRVELVSPFHQAATVQWSGASINVSGAPAYGALKVNTALQSAGSAGTLKSDDGTLLRTSAAADDDSVVTDSRSAALATIEVSPALLY